MSSSLTLTSGQPPQDYDRLKEVKQFDDSKLGVKGLLDSGLTSSIPLIFQHPPDSRPAAPTNPQTRPASAHSSVPIIDLSAPRPAVVDQIRRAASAVGFFQITNHGVPLDVIQRTLSAVKAFNELPIESKSPKFVHSGVFTSDSILLVEWNEEELLEWNEEVEKVLGLLSEGLGVEEGRLKEMTCLGGRTMAAYPFLPTLYGSMDSPKWSCLLTELCPGGEEREGLEVV